MGPAPPAVTAEVQVMIPVAAPDLTLLRAQDLIQEVAEPAIIAVAVVPAAVAEAIAEVLQAAALVAVEAEVAVEAGDSLLCYN